MPKDFVLTYTKMIAAYPEDISVEIKTLDDSTDEILIYANLEDVGRLVGKKGRMIHAIRAVISGCKTKYKKNYTADIKANS